MWLHIGFATYRFQTCRISGNKVRHYLLDSHSFFIPYHKFDVSERSDFVGV